MLPEDGRPAVGLRERKKAKTRAAIQQQALRLFREQGYDDTTVQQIAAAAEVSSTTFFRYFPTKEDVVLYDATDPLFIAAFEAQPAALSPIQAVGATLRAVFEALPAEELATQRKRAEWMLTVPDLRMRVVDEAMRSSALFAALVAKRVGRRADDLKVRIFVGAVSGAIMSAVLAGAEDPAADYLALMDAGLAHLDAGLPL